MKLEDTSEGTRSAEVVMLEERIAALEEALREAERALRAAERAVEDSHEAQQLLHIVMDHIPMSIFWKDRESTYIGCNQRYAQDANVASPAEIVGKKDIEMSWSAQTDRYRADDLAVMEAGVPKLNYEEPQDQPDGWTRWIRTSKIPMRDKAGQIVAVLGMYEDITARKEAEAEQLRLQQEVILAHKRALSLLSAPLIPISDGVVALILIGAIDEERGSRITETLLQGISANRASVAIIDITGVTDMGANAATVLLNAARAAQLLGAKAILTGIAPDAARALVEIGADLGQIETLGNLQAGIESALGHRRR